jgi:hypothetical protein
MQLALEEFSNRSNEFTESHGIWINFVNGNLFKCYLYLVLLLNPYMEDKIEIHSIRKSTHNWS